MTPLRAGPPQDWASGAAEPRVVAAFLWNANSASHREAATAVSTGSKRNGSRASPSKSYINCIK